MRATNEALLRQDLAAAATAAAASAEEKKESMNADAETKESNTTTSSATVTGLPPADSAARLRKKSQNLLSRSDSTGSSSGRKYLVAPTLSDPQVARNEKATFGGTTGVGQSSGCPASKKKPCRPSAPSHGPKTASHFVELNHLHNHLGNAGGGGGGGSGGGGSSSTGTGSYHHHQHLHHHHHHHLHTHSAYGDGGQLQPNSAASGSRDSQHGQQPSASIQAQHHGTAQSQHHHHQLLQQQQLQQQQQQHHQVTKVLANNNQVALVYEVHDWWSEQIVGTQNSDDEA